jgi:beta-lactamase regulating signal transducer with metallopeptidase domain
MNAPMQAWMLVTGWTLIHFVWQGGLLGVATAAGLRLCRRRSSTTRYAIACIGLTAMLAAPAVTAAVLREPASVTLSAGSVSPAVAGEAIHSTMQQTAPDGSLRSANGAAGIRLELDPWLPYIVWTWITGVIVLMARFAGGSWRVHRLRVASLAEAVSPWQAAGERLAARLRLDVAFRVVESGLVDTPSVIGFLRPVILLPLAVLSNLSPGQVEALLAHELAHIRRRDYAVNLLQTAAETLLFFHPAVWWVSSRIREEREHCCDDVAVEVCGEPTAYAAALAELASWRSREIALAVGAAGGPLLARVRRLVGAPEEDEPRSASGLAVLAIALIVTAGVAVQSTSQDSSSPGPLANHEAAAVTALQLAGTTLLRKTDHFDIYYPPDLDLHAERVWREAERAYERVSADLKHNLAFHVPILLFRTAGELQESTQAGGSERTQATSATNPEGDRILLAVDQPADQWYGRIVHEVAHVFAFDILPGTATPLWIMEGLAEYQRPAWDPDDLVALRTAVRANAVPSLSAGRGEDNSRDPRQIASVGHAAFDFIESRWGKAGVRQFLFALRQSAPSGADPFQGAFQIKRDEFERTFEQYLRERFAAAADLSLVGRFDYRATLHLEGEITATRASVEEGLACIELWVPTERETRQRWGIECGTEPAVDVVRGLKPGDRVIVTGPPAREPAAQRMVVQSLERPSDGFTWRARSR